MKLWSTNEEHVYEERLALLGVFANGNPTPAQDNIALDDVDRFRLERSDKEPVKKKGME
jgi:hypothetical protein